MINHATNLNLNVHEVPCISVAGLRFFMFEDIRKLLALNFILFYYFEPHVEQSNIQTLTKYHIFAGKKYFPKENIWEGVKYEFIKSYFKVVIPRSYVRQKKMVFSTSRSE